MKQSTSCVNYSTGTPGTSTTKVEFTVTQVNWEEHQEEIKLVRTQVFIIEQHVPVNLEWDEHDKTAFHLIAVDIKKNPVGTARLLPSGQIGRMAVLKPFRGSGIGTALLKKLVRLAIDYDIHPLYLNAQVHATGFYQRNGFTTVGDVFDDAGIPHCRMIHGSQ